MCRLQNLFIIAFLLVILVSCEKIIDEKIAVNEPKLVLNAFLNPDTLFAVSVTQSIPILTKDTFIFIADASVKIYENDSLIEELPYDKNLKIYKSVNQRPAIGKNYRIEVIKSGFTTTTADVSIPVPVKIISVDTFSMQSQSEFYGYPYVKVFKTTFNDPGNEENFYIMYFERHNYNVINKTSYISPQFMMIRNAIIDLVGDNLFSDYRRTQNNDGIDLSNNNYFGGTYFALSDMTFNGKSITLEFELQDNIRSDSYPDSISYVVKLYSINKDYFTYINSESLYSPGGDPFTEAVSVYSNVKGGYGIAFGSSTSSKAIILVK